MDTQSQTTELSLQISALRYQAGGTGRYYHPSLPCTQGRLRWKTPGWPAHVRLHVSGSRKSQDQFMQGRLVQLCRECTEQLGNYSVNQQILPYVINAKKGISSKVHRNTDKRKLKPHREILGDSRGRIRINAWKMDWFQWRRIEGGSRERRVMYLYCSSPNSSLDPLAFCNWLSQF